MNEENHCLGGPMGPNVTVSRHPLVLHKVAMLRSTDTPPALFRLLVRALSQVLFFDESIDANAGKETPFLSDTSQSMFSFSRCRSRPLSLSLSHVRLHGRPPQAEHGGGSDAQHGASGGRLVQVQGLPASHTGAARGGFSFPPLLLRWSSSASHADCRTAICSFDNRIYSFLRVW